MINCEKIWITGTSGMVGRSVAKYLIDKNYQVVKLSNSGKNYKDIYNINYQDKKHISDLTKSTFLPDALIHFGWGGMTDPQSDIHLYENFENSSNLFSNLYELGLKKIIFIGSIEEYGERNGKLEENLESLGKLRNYEKGKIKVAKFARKLSKETNNIFIHIRLANTYGLPQKENSMISILQNAYSNNVYPKFGPCNIGRDYIYLNDVSSGINSLLGLDSSGIFNLGSGNMITIKDFAKTYWELLGGNSNDIIFDTKSNTSIIRKVYMDISKIKNITGWTPRFSIEEGIREMISEYINLNLK